MIRLTLLAGAGLAMFAPWNVTATTPAAAPLDYLVQPVVDGGVVKGAPQCRRRLGAVK